MKQENNKKEPQKIIKAIIKYFIVFIIMLGLLLITTFRRGTENWSSSSYVIFLVLDFVLAAFGTFAIYKSDKRREKEFYDDMPEVLRPYYDVYATSVGEENAKFMEDIKKNGYSEKMLKTADKIIADYKNGKSIDKLLLKDFVMYPAEYCCIKQEYQKALDYLNVISADDLMEEKIIKLNGGISVYSYFDTKIEACRGLGDKFLADDVMREAKKYFEMEGLSDSKLFFKDISLYDYYMLLGEFEKAKECAERLLTYKTIELKGVTAYIKNAEIMNKFNDKDNFIKMMGIARNNAINTLAPLRQYYNEYLKRFGLDEKPLEISTDKH